jgi:hypothetical protein
MKDYQEPAALYIAVLSWIQKSLQRCVELVST